MILLLRLLDLGWEIYRQGEKLDFLGSTASKLREVSDVTGFPEILGGQ